MTMGEWKDVDQSPGETAADYRKKADWHYRRAGDARVPNASLGKGLQYTWNAELMERAVS